MTNKKELTLQNIKNAKKAVTKRIDMNDVKVINYAVSQLESARSYYDGVDGMTMTDLLDTYGVLNSLYAEEELKDDIFDESDNASKVNKDKNLIKKIDNIHVDYVITHNSDLPAKMEISFITNKDVLKIANMMETVIKKPLSYYKFLAKYDVNFAFVRLVNYLIDINKTDLLKKRHLAERRSIMRSLDLFSSHIQKNLKKQLQKLWDTDVFKVTHLNSKNMSIEKPKTKDVISIINAL